MLQRKKRLLFVCTANLQRSPTAEQLFRDSSRYEAKSAGIHPSAPQPVSKELVDWTDTIFVFSEKNEGQKSFLLERFHLDPEKVIDLDIDDVHDRNDPRLIAILKKKLKKYVDVPG